jgi:glycerate dehydrogenase
MEHVVFLDRDTLPTALRRAAFAHTWTDHPATRPEQVVPRLAGATVAVVNKVVLTGSAIAQLPQLRFVAVAATGVNNVDVAACRARGIAVSNIRRYGGVSVSEHVFALTLALRRQLTAYRADLLAGAWQRSESFCLLTHPLRDLRGSTLGIVGHGDLGRHVSALGAAMGMRVLVAERKGAAVCRPDRTPFDDVLRQSDVLSLHAALTPDTEQLIGAAELALMPAHALLINTARGGLVDEVALLAALQAGRLGGAGLDVLSEEPPRHGSALLDVDLPNLLITPHIAWASQESLQRLADQLIDNLEAYARGTPQNVVTN